MEIVKGLVIDAFTGATERHIEVGDGLELFIVEKGKGVRVEYLGEFFPCPRFHENQRLCPSFYLRFRAIDLKRD